MLQPSGAVRLYREKMMGRDLPVMVTEVPLTRLCEPLSISYDMNQKG